jgi:hypothetical protein
VSRRYHRGIAQRAEGAGWPCAPRSTPPGSVVNRGGSGQKRPSRGSRLRSPPRRRPRDRGWRRSADFADGGTAMRVVSNAAMASMTGKRRGDRRRRAACRAWRDRHRCRARRANHAGDFERRRARHGGFDAGARGRRIDGDEDRQSFGADRRDRAVDQRGDSGASVASTPLPAAAWSAATTTCAADRRAPCRARR